MENEIKIKINGMECLAERGSFILEAARKHNIYIPTLCNLPDIRPSGSCRICTVIVNGRKMTACTTPVAEGMDITTESPELTDLRSAIVELLFVEGNHFCPACEKSGNCELQALAYRFRMMAPRFPYQFPKKEIEASNAKLIKDHNRCVLCKRCVRTIKDENGRSYFAFKKRAHQLIINLDHQLAEEITDEIAQKAMDVCPVGALIRKEKGFEVPIGKRRYDKKPIGYEVEKHEFINT